MCFRQGVCQPHRKLTQTFHKKQHFSRIKVEEVDPNSIIDNSYMAKVKRHRFLWMGYGQLIKTYVQGGAESSYGLKAHQDLIVTRGKGFRTEKNKVNLVCLPTVAEMDFPNAFEDYRKNAEATEVVRSTPILIPSSSMKIRIN